MKSSKTKTNKEIENPETDYVVEKILKKRQNNGITEYLLKWKNYSDDYNTWEPEENLQCPTLIKQYEKQANVVQNPERTIITRNYLANSTLTSTSSLPIVNETKHFDKHTSLKHTTDELDLTDKPKKAKRTKVNSVNTNNDGTQLEDIGRNVKNQKPKNCVRSSTCDYTKASPHDGNLEYCEVDNFSQCNKDDKLEKIDTVDIPKKDNIINNTTSEELGNDNLIIDPPLGSGRVVASSKGYMANELDENEKADSTNNFDLTNVPTYSKTLQSFYKGIRKNVEIKAKKLNMNRSFLFGNYYDDKYLSSNDKIEYNETIKDSILTYNKGKKLKYADCVDLHQEVDSDTAVSEELEYNVDENNTPKVPEVIISSAKIRNEYLYFIKWDHEELADLVPSRTAIKICPKHLIQYYETRLKDSMLLMNKDSTLSTYIFGLINNL